MIDTSKPHVQFLFVYDASEEELAKLQSELNLGRRWYTACAHVPVHKRHGYYVSIPTATELSTRGVFYQLYGLQTAFMIDMYPNLEQCRLWFRVSAGGNIHSSWVSVNLSATDVPFTDFESLIPTST